MFEWSATIEGIRPISKKNSKRIVGKRLIASEAFMKFERLALPILAHQAPAKPYTGEVSLLIHVYMKGKITMDWDNAGSSWSDLLQDAGVILDDDQVMDGRVIKHRGAPDWRCEILVQSH